MVSLRSNPRFQRAAGIGVGLDARWVQVLSAAAGCAADSPSHGSEKPGALESSAPDIPVTLRQVLDDTKAWIEHHAYLPDEIAVPFHHRLVQIHPFPNGNGRHSRLVADLLVMSLGGERFTWGSATLHGASDVRQRYVHALRAADQHNLAPLPAFARA